jgi:hypothetical protein
MPRRDYDSDLEPRRRRRRRERSDTNIGLIVAILGIGFLVVVGGVVGVYLLLRLKPVGVPVASNRSDLEQLVGEWECTFRDPAGNVTMRKVKKIVGNSETATWYRPDGVIFRVNEVTFDLTTRGRDKLFRYFNGWVRVGPDAGHPFPSGEYVYTLEGDTWTEFDPGGPIVWTRRK